MSEGIMELEIGSTVIIDGTAWTVEQFKGATARATSDEQGKAIWFATADARYLGAGLFGLPGRIEPPTTPAGAVVAGVAAAAVRG